MPARLGTTVSPSPATLFRARAIAEALFARGGAPPPAERMTFVVCELEDFLARAGTRSRCMLTFSLWAVATLAPLVAGRFARFTSLPVAERVAALEALEARLPEPLLAVKALLCLVYYEHPDAAREVGVTVPHLVAAPSPPEGSAP